MRVLVCGGRDYGYRLRGIAFGTPQWNSDTRRIAAERKLLTETLDGIGITVLIHGAARGADELASLWAAKQWGVEPLPFPANWYPRGRRGGLDKSAGPKRNQRMIDEGRPELVVAFPGGTGTADMVSKAEAAGIRVLRPSPSHGGA